MLSTIFLAFGLYNVHAVSAVTEGGTLGLTLLLENWFSISPSITAFICNVICYGIGWKLLGKSFIIYSAVSTVSFSVTYKILEQFPPIFPQIAKYPLLAAILGALFVGIGTGICVRCGGATAGDDALAMSISCKFHLKVEQVYLISDVTVLLLSLTYIPHRRILYSLFTVILSGQIIGWIQRIPSKNSHKEKKI